MEAKKILIIEDDINIIKGLVDNLEIEGFKVEFVRNGEDALNKLNNSISYDLILLDIMLPDIDGIQICKQIREKNIMIPIIFLTARDERWVKIKGFREGADDYITKPFDIIELIERIKAILRRVHTSSCLKIRDIELDIEKGIAYKSGKKIPFTLKDIQLLKYLYENRGRVISREEILTKVWGYTIPPHTRTVDNHIAHIRKFLEKDPSKPEIIKSIRSEGYIMEI